MVFKILTIFPEFYESVLKTSLLGKSIQKGIIKIEIYNLRSWSTDRSIHKKVDDRPYGGGPGMIMMIEPVYRALKDIQNQDLKKQKKSCVIIFSPKGQEYNQTFAYHLKDKYDEIIMVCPHYEGFDERIMYFADYEISIGKYVLSGGDIPALVVLDSVARLIPGFMKNPESIVDESYSIGQGEDDLTEYPQYTRPAIFRLDDGTELKVPEILLSGDHERIKKWREGQKKKI
ncbi:MAG: tRNA (guanosine(37)-N1)-methyltransferase TrmD [Candidatus Dojkabacteria bacterium]|nr:tRNA (guanosine(37)-N1)-methyltransferase TrmD [Candidatus Dojkabacteria bacterium]